MTNRAVIVGINDYSQQQSLPPGWSVGNLSACVADATSMNDLMTTVLDVTVTALLTDAAASRDAILGAVHDLLAASQAGDVAAVVYSGHGGRFPADDANPQRYYESLIPASGAPITDLDIYALADSLQPSVVNFTLILDSCYSGGIHEDTPDSQIRSAAYTPDYVAACIANMTTVVPCGATLVAGDTDYDGNVSAVIGQGNGLVCSVDDNKSLIPSSKSTVIAACRYDESAWEANGHGALTQAVLDTVTAGNHATTSYRQLIDQLRSDVQNTLGQIQTPTLLGQDNRMDEVFLAGWTQSKVGAPATP